MSTKEQRDAAEAEQDRERQARKWARERVEQLCVELGHGFVVSEAAQAWATYVPPPSVRGGAPMRYSGVATWLSSLLRGFKRAADLEKAVVGVVVQGVGIGHSTTDPTPRAGVIVSHPSGETEVRDLSPTCLEVLRGLVHGPRVGGTDAYADAYAWLRDHGLITWDHFKATPEGRALLEMAEQAEGGGT